jgi:hypothetical protein
VSTSVFKPNPKFLLFPVSEGGGYMRGNRRQVSVECDDVPKGAVGAAALTVNPQAFGSESHR